MSIITNYIVKKILSESVISQKEGTSGKFILKNYPLATFQSLLDYFFNNNHDEILIIVDERLDLVTTSSKIIKTNHEVMAQFRNENVQNTDINLDDISYIIFITNEVIDTLNDISTLSPDDIKSEFSEVVGSIENTLLDRKTKKILQDVCKVFLKELDGMTPFEMESFVDSTIHIMDKEGYVLEEAMGMSLNTLGAFKCKKLFEPLKRSSLIKDIKKLVKDFKSISAALGKRIGNKTVSEEDLNEKYKNNSDEFSLLENEKQELIKKFIFSDERERLAYKDKFSTLDWYSDSVYRLFEKTKSDTSKKLGQETIDLLEEKDIEVGEREKESLLLYDSLPPKERPELKSILEPIYKQHKGHIEEFRALRGKWDKFLYPAQSKSTDFILGLLETIKKLKADSENIDHIVVSLKQTQTTAIMRNYTKHAINYLHKRYSVLNRISKAVQFEFQFIQDIEDKLNATKPSPVVKKYKTGSLSKTANELHFIVQAQASDNTKLAERKLIWSFNPKSIMSGYKEDIEATEKHLEVNCLYANKVYRASGSEKGEKKPLSLLDFSSLESRGKNAGYRLFPKTCDHPISSKHMIKSAMQILEKEEFTSFSNLFSEFTKEYQWLLKQLDISENLLKSDFDFSRVENISKVYTNICTMLFDKSDDDQFKSTVIEPFLSLTTVRIGQENSVIIPSFHPLRLISYFVKLKHTFSFIDTYITTNEVSMIKEDLYFSDLEQSFSTPYYPEVFRLFDVERDEESLLHISEVCDDYTIMEPIQNYLDSGQSTDPSAQTTILTKVIENYLELNNHKQSSLKVLLHAVNNYDFPVKFMKKLMTLDFIAKENNFEIYLNDVDPSHIRKMYRSFLINQNSKDAEEALEYNEVSFLSNIRLNAFDQSFKQLDNVNDQLNIAFLNDFVSSKAKLEFRNQLLNVSHDLYDYHPTMWSKRKYMTEKESSVGKYLVSPAKSELTSAFYNLLYLTMSTHRDDYKDKLPTLNVDRKNTELHTDLEAIHKRTDWVINLDSLLDKKILEEFGANVIKYRKARHINRNLVVSSKANTILLESHLIKKFKDFNVKEEVIKSSVEYIIKSANELSGDILLKAIGRGSFANEMLGLVLTKTILEGCTQQNNILIYIDDYADWFLSSVNSEEKLLLSQSQTLADILSLTPVFIDDKLTTVYIDIIESKFCNTTNYLKHAKKSLEQTVALYEKIKKVYGQEDYFDKEYWLAKIADLIVETHHKSFTKGLSSEDVRNAIRMDKSINFIVRGMSYVFVHNLEEDNQHVTEIEGVKQYIIGSNSIVSMIESLPEFKLVSSELTWPKYDNVEGKSLPEVIPPEIIVPPITLPTLPPIVTPPVVPEDESIEEVEQVSRDVKQVVMHHNYRAKIKHHLFTPNSLRISLEPELGWKPKIFYNMSNDFLTVKGLELLRVEPVKGAYDLVFRRENRQIISYEECLIDRELSDGFGNTKILLGRNEENNKVVYYNLDSEDPHALIAGMTKSGKSVLLNIFIVDMITTNTIDELKLILVDPKKVEFTRYKNIPYLDEDGIITNKDLAIVKLHGLVTEMEKRYSLFSEAGVNELSKYNNQVTEKLPRIILIFDEFADWMLDDEFKRDVSSAVQSLSGKARAAGIHLVVSTQRPDNTVVVPILRANLGAKFALRVDSEKNSNIILDEPGAEKLLGYGHMIVKFAGEKQYVQSAFMSDDYIDNVLKNI